VFERLAIVIFGAHAHFLFLLSSLCKLRVDVVMVSVTRLELI
jgi:hypothetical protein